MTTHALPPAHLDTNRAVQITPLSGRKPLTVARLSDWIYIEHSLMRLLAAWGRLHCEWADKVALHRHVFEQAQCVQALRDRLSEFPGTVSNLDAPVSSSLENLVNTVLLAPSFEDALDGIYATLNGALNLAYQGYGASAHPVHDAPTLATLHAVLAYKNGMRLWHRDYRRRVPHTLDGAYAAKIEAALEAVFHLQKAVPLDGDKAAPCGVRTGFELPRFVGKQESWTPKYEFEPFIERDFSANIETRRFFWCLGYLREMGLAEEMLRWVWAAHPMPWKYQFELARHLWDESRHGDSGLSRFLDFGITLEDVGYGDGQTETEKRQTVPNMTPRELFDQAFFIGMVAETTHFAVKNESYADFRDGGDLESAEMMLFDVIDEGNHVRYCHEWLPELAQQAGIELGDYRKRAAQIRADHQKEADQKAELARQNPILNDPQNPSFQQFERLIQIMRDKSPLSNLSTCPPRSGKPM